LLFEYEGWRLVFPSGVLEGGVEVDDKLLNVSGHITTLTVLDPELPLVRGLIVVL